MAEGFDIEEILRGGNENTSGFNKELSKRGKEILSPLFEELSTSDKVIEKTYSIFSGKDGSVELPPEAAQALYEGGILAGYTKEAGRSEDFKGWSQNESKPSSDNTGQSHVWKEFRVKIPGMDTPITTEVWLRAKEIKGTHDLDFNTWVLSREPFGSNINVQSLPEDVEEDFVDDDY